jgi:hypothetical protein
VYIEFPDLLNYNFASVRTWALLLFRDFISTAPETLFWAQVDHA